MMMELPKTEIPALRGGDVPLLIEVPEAMRAYVLIVDDNPAKLTSLEVIVSGMSLKVVTATSGRGALRQLLQHDFAVILLDVVMPIMDGYETARLIHSRQRSAQVPIIFTTAEVLTEESRFKGYAAGAVDWIAPPIEPSVLRAKIKVFVDLFHLNYIVRQEAQQRREAEEALRRSEATLQKILDLLPVGVFVADALGKLTQVNPAGKEIWAGVRYVEGVEQYGEYRGWWLDNGKPIAADEWALARTLKSGEEVRNEAVEIQCFDGSRKIILNSAMALRDAEQQIVGGVAVNMDVTDLKHTEQQLRASSEEIRTKNAQLERSNQMKSEFLANMSHELRTPLNAIIGFSELFKDGLLGELSAEQKGYITDIFNSGEHLLSLINDILDLSKVEAGKMVLETEPMEIVALLQNCLSIVKEKAHKHRIAVSLNLADAPGHIVADARKVKQIVYNLLSNAVKFSQDNGQVEISARAVKRDALALIAPEGIAVRQLPLPANQWHDFLEIKVCDSGIGIAAADLDRLFQAFQQLDASLTRHFEGTGLGLALVKSMANLHGGTVAVASAPGKGSCFAVWLPCRTEGGASAEAIATQVPLVAAPAANDTVTLGAKLVLVIEDDDRAAQVLHLYLESAGFRIAHASDAQRGLEMAQHERPDLIILDLIMPGMGGWEMLEHLKANPSLAGVPVVIVSIHDVPNQAGFALGAAKALQKPVQRETLLGALRELGFSGKTRQKFVVLAVDDEPKGLDLIAAILAGVKNCTLLRANGGQEAINRVRQAVPDLLILDLMMPGLSGFDVIDALKANPATATMPILILTAKTVTQLEREQLNGRVLKIMETSTLKREHFLAEVQRALGEDRP